MGTKLANTSSSNRRFHSRKGFALVLVFSLAGVVLLLGLSMISLIQVDSASSRYDQGMRVARANARLALQMAIGDLQSLAGPDQRATATADAARTPLDDDFNDTELPATSGVYEPFWTGVWDNNNTTNLPIWLVTRPLDASYTIGSVNQDADPYASDLGVGATSYDDVVKMIGVGSAKPNPSGGDQTLHDVYVPKEPLLSDSILGMEGSEQATVGHYAYWVGDNGVKASYLLEDFVPETLHDIYESGGSPTNEQKRLEQILAHRFHLEVDGTEVDAADTRIASIASEFALRQEEDSSGNSFLGSYSQNDVLRRFHDFTGMSKGLLVDTVRGGLKEDLSNIHAVNTADADLNELVNEYLMPYLNVGAYSPTSPTELTRSYAIAPRDISFGGGNPRPVISPIITEFNLLIRLSTPDFEEAPSDESPVYSEFGVSVELWNPYTSRLAGEPITLRILNLDEAIGIDITYDQYRSTGNLITVEEDKELLDIMNNVTDFVIPAPGVGEDWWNPGEVRVFSGAYPTGGASGSPVILSPGITIPGGSTHQYEIAGLRAFLTEEYEANQDNLWLSSDGASPWTPQVALRNASGDELYRYTLDGIVFNEIKSSSTPANDTAQPHLSYKIEIRNPDSNWQNFDPRNGEITSNLLMDDFNDPSAPPVDYDPISMAYYEYPGSSIALNAPTSYQNSDTVLLGDNQSGTVEHNIPIFELPRQEYLSLGGLQMAEFPLGIRHQLGMSLSLNPSTSINDVFDRFFLSTVPQSGTTTWTVDSPLPNARMKPVSGALVSDLQDPDSAEHLYLNGAFNVNSTSIEAWTAILKGTRLGTWTFEDPAGVTPVAGQEQLDVTGENQFFRFSQSAEETWQGAYDPMEDIELSREFFRKGMRSLTNSEVESLAIEIVERIRTRRQSASGLVGPFVSLQDFIDSGVIEDAIAATTINDSVVVNSEALFYSSSFLTQQDILTAIAPFLTTRSDTFVIRAYGDAVNPFDDTQVLARAYCEAIVQRIHSKHATEYADTPGNIDPMIPTLNTAGRLGREFRVIAFRWLAGDEI